MSDEKANAPKYYVAVGASAGGLEAIEKFFTSMPVDTDLAFIVIQHLSPDYKSLMVELLSKYTEISVKRAENEMLVEKNTIYLIPPNKTMTIFHGKLILRDQDHSSSINLPIDIFFTSLADDQGEKSIGVVLSGTGSDGTRGIRSIKESGGLVMVQSEDSAKFNGMPKNAIATGLVDYIKAPEEMPKELLSYVEHPYVTKKERAETQEGLPQIFAMLRDKQGVDFTYYKPNTILRRLERRMAVNQINDLQTYISMMETNTSEINALFKDLLIGVTNFFRDKDAFRYLQTELLPEMITNNDNEEFRVWVPGCSTGEEAYTIAILIKETLDKLDKNIPVKIFATDLDEDAIIFASNALYTESIVADVPREYLSKYFIRKDSGYCIARTIREMVVFAKQNLIKDPPFTRMNLISCRNLLIYLQPVMQQKALEMFSFALKLRGYMFLGSSESTNELSENFDVIDSSYKIFQSKVRNHRITSDTELIRNMQQFPKQRIHLAMNQNTIKYYDEDKIFERLLNTISDGENNLIIVINENYEVLHTFGETKNYLIVPKGRMNNEITKMAIPELAVPMATGIRKVLKTGNNIEYSNIGIPAGEGTLQVNLKVRTVTEEKNQETLISIVIEEQKYRQAMDIQDSVSEYDMHKELQQRVQDLEQELQFNKESLQATIEELETSNEELQATNEELLASNEELQSTNEELQSVNEELYTVNSEHQSKIFELTELTNDLDNLLSSTQIGTLFLDQELSIRKFTPLISEIFRIKDHDIGRALDDLKHDIEDLDIIKEVKDVYINTTQKSIEAKDKNGNWYLIRILPYNIAPETYSGIVVTFININDVKDAKRKLKKETARRRRVMQSARIGYWEWNIETDNIFWDNVAGLFGIEENDFDGTLESFVELVHPDDREMVNKAIKRTIETNEKYDIEHRINNDNSEQIWLREIGQLEFNKKGEPELMTGIIQDVTSIRKKCK